MDLVIEFCRFMEEMDNRISSLGLDITKYPIDHMAFRVTNQTEYVDFREKFKSLSVAYTTKFFHEREFYCMFLREPFVWKNIKVHFLEFAQPGGSDSYELGFQHIEILTPLSFNDVFPNEKYKEMLFTPKYEGEEPYIKWEDKKVLKLKRTPIIVESFTQENPTVNLIS